MHKHKNSIYTHINVHAYHESQLLALIKKGEEERAIAAKEEARRERQARRGVYALDAARALAEEGDFERARSMLGNIHMCVCMCVCV